MNLPTANRFYLRERKQTYSFFVLSKIKRLREYITYIDLRITEFERFYLIRELGQNVRNYTTIRSRPTTYIRTAASPQLYHSTLNSGYIRGFSK